MEKHKKEIMATKKLKKSSSLFQVETLQETAKNLHDGALHVSDNLVDVSLAAGAKWQKIMVKAINQGTVLMAKQQDLLLTTLEEIKGQYKTGNKRFKKLVGTELPKAKKLKKVIKTETAKIEKTAKAVVTKKTKAATKTVKKVKAKVAKPVVAKKVKVAKKTVKKVTVAKADDLTLIKGVGPKVASLFNKAGIKTFKKLASTNLKDLKTILNAAGPRFKNFDPKTLRTEATKLAKK